MSAIDLASGFTRSWVRLYTRRLDPAVGQARVQEIESDLWEHRHEAEEASMTEVDAALQIWARCLAGMPADLAWRAGAPKAESRREAMNDVIRRTWWLLPAALVGLFDLFLFFAQVTRTSWLASGLDEPRVGVRLAASALFLLFAVCLWAGIWLRNRRPQRAGWLVIVGCLPALVVPWMVVPLVLAGAAVVGAIVNMTSTPAPANSAG